MAPPKQELQISKAGLINDVEDEMKRLIRKGFNGGSEYLENIVKQPKHFEKQNPDSTVIDDVPAFYVWVGGIDIEQAGLGGQSGRNIRNTFNLFCHYRYIIGEAKPEEDKEEMKQIGWWLLFWIIENMDLNKKVSGNPEIADLIIEPSWNLVGGEMKKTTSLEIQMKYPFTMKRRVSS